MGAFGKYLNSLTLPRWREKRQELMDTIIGNGVKYKFSICRNIVPRTNDECYLFIRGLSVSLSYIEDELFVLNSRVSKSKKGEKIELNTLVIIKNSIDEWYKNCTQAVNVSNLKPAEDREYLLYMDKIYGE